MREGIEARKWLAARQRQWKQMTDTHPPPLESNPSYLVKEVTCDATIEALNGAIADHGIVPHHIISILFVGGKYHIFYTEPRQ